MTEFRQVPGELTWTMKQLSLLAIISDRDSTFNAKFSAIVKLRELIDAELAAEYDRGYETALRMETDLQKDAWDEGFSEGTGYGAYLEGGYGDYPTPVNPYLHPATPDDSVAPQTPPATG